MFEFLHNAMHPLDLDGLVWAWGQAGAYWRAYWGSWDAWRRGAAAPRSWRWKHNVLGTVRRVFRWRPWSREKLSPVPTESVVDYCERCGHVEHGSGHSNDSVFTGEDDVIMCVPDPCGAVDCECLGDDRGSEDCTCDDEL